jgi:hypothetical protein
MEKIVEGNKSGSVVVKQGGDVVAHRSRHDGNGQYAMHVVNGNLPEKGFVAGRTIELARYEFCRLKLGLRVKIPAGIDHDDVWSALEAFVLEMVRKEEAAVSKAEYVQKLMPEGAEHSVLSRCTERVMDVSYGLTLKSTTNQYESHQVDILQGYPISDGADLFEEYGRLSDEMAEIIARHHDRIKGLGQETGL